MLNLSKLFGKSPFAPLQSHMKRVASCAQKLSTIMRKLPDLSREEVARHSQELSELEHEADLTKNDIRNHLPKSLFLPIDRSQFLEILSIQDSIADKIEEVGILLTLRALPSFQEVHKQLEGLFEKNYAVFQQSANIIQEIDELLESSFGGLEAEKVREMVEKTAFEEHKARMMRMKLLQELYSSGDKLNAADFSLLDALVREISAISGLSEKLANRIRMVLELK